MKKVKKTKKLCQNLGSDKVIKYQGNYYQK